MQSRTYMPDPGAPLVDTAWLAARLGDDRLHVIEVGRDANEYERAHIPGAVAWTCGTDLHTPDRRDALTQRDLTRLLRSSGVRRGGTIVLYGGDDNWFAAHAYWVLKLRGYDGAKLLDGGRRAWELEDRPMTQSRSLVATTDVNVRGLLTNRIRAFRDEVVAAAAAHPGGDELTFLDVRSPEEYRGERLHPEELPGEVSQVAGHIPGARNIPWDASTNRDGTYRRAGELRELYAEAGLTPDRDIVTYCSVGERSAHSWFVLHELLGYPNVKNYDGSWTEYGSLVGVPVEVESMELSSRSRRRP
jgi:thiosulfate/3-mercaptopyruvate sulfurtransferase